MKRLANNVRKQHPQAYTPAQVEVMLSMFAAGATIKEVGAAINRTANSISVFCHKKGWTTRQLRNWQPKASTLKRKERRDARTSQYS